MAPDHLIHLGTPTHQVALIPVDSGSTLTVSRGATRVPPAGDYGTTMQATALTSAGVLSYLLVGAVTGWVLGRFIKTGHLILFDAAIGALGALLARYLISAVTDTAATGWWLTAMVGAAVPLGISRLRDMS
jgi:uncharacterized membrane protein YeaQ/YmgE (transglycosylase-associated protein family)